VNYSLFPQEAKQAFEYAVSLLEQLIESPVPIYVEANWRPKGQLVMTARHELKFTDKAIKEIAYELGFSSPDYFSYFLKKHTGSPPSKVKKS
jgi:hypothetical protein